MTLNLLIFVNKLFSDHCHNHGFGAGAFVAREVSSVWSTLITKTWVQQTLRFDFRKLLPTKHKENLGLCKFCCQYIYRQQHFYRYTGLNLSTDQRLRLKSIQTPP